MFCLLPEHLLRRHIISLKSTTIKVCQSCYLLDFEALNGLLQNTSSGHKQLSLEIQM